MRRWRTAESISSGSAVTWGMPSCRGGTPACRLTAFETLLNCSTARLQRAPHTTPHAWEHCLVSEAPSLILQGPAPDCDRPISMVGLFAHSCRCRRPVAVHARARCCLSNWALRASRRQWTSMQLPTTSPAAYTQYLSVEMHGLDAVSLGHAAHHPPLILARRIPGCRRRNRGRGTGSRRHLPPDRPTLASWC